MDPPVELNPPTDPPNGIVPLVESNPKHREFVETVCPPYVLIKLTDVENIVQTGETASSYFGDYTTVITTTTVRDEYLNRLTYQEEVDLLKAFEPDIHIPADEPVYVSHDRETRVEQIKKMLTGFLAVNKLLNMQSDAFTSEPPTLFPLIKGVTPDEWELCYNFFSHTDVQLAAFYAVQYFTGDQIRTDELVGTLRAIDATAPSGLDLFVIGGLGPKLVDQYPDRVVAASGLNQWYGRISPLYDDSDGPTPTLPLRKAKVGYTDIATTVNENLDARSRISVRPEFYKVDGSLQS